MSGKPGRDGRTGLKARSKDVHDPRTPTGVGVCT